MFRARTRPGRSVTRRSRRRRTIKQLTGLITVEGRFEHSAGKQLESSLLGQIGIVGVAASFSSLWRWLVFWM